MESEAACDLLRNPDVCVVWLTARPDTLLARLAGQGDRRPVIAGVGNDVAGGLRRLLRRRRCRYLAVSDHVVATDGLTEAEAALAVARRIRTEVSP